MRRLTVILVILVSATSTCVADLSSHLDLATIRSIPVQHDGRWPPLDTLARDVVESTTGQMFYLDADPVLWLLSWTFEPQAGMLQPLIAVSNAELRRELQLPEDKTRFSYAELLAHERLQELSEQLTHRDSHRKMDPLESKVADIEKKLDILHKVFEGRIIRLIPERVERNGAWRSIQLPPDKQDQPDAVQLAWAELKQAFVIDDAAAFATASKALASVLDSLPAAHRPAPRLIATELRFNQIQPFHIAWMIMVAGAILAAFAAMSRLRPLTWLAVGMMLAGFAMLTYGLSMRWLIAGRIPAANMYESLLFLSWGMGAFGIISMIFMRDRVVPLTASALGAVSLLLAEALPLDHFVRPIPPVLLDTFWMSIHVPVIMVSYSVLALAALVAHTQLLVMAAAPGQKKLIAGIDALHYWYVQIGCLLLGAGILTGSMWAASSWGRYWGWDPKEVWSLIAFLAYLAILHIRANHLRPPGWAYAIGVGLCLALTVIISSKISPMNPIQKLCLIGAILAVALFVFARGPFATALKSVLTFWLVIMTYVGVNFVLGIGLHSYGFGTGTVVRYMLLLGGVDLLLILLCSIVYLLRRTSEPAPAPASAQI